MEEIRTADSKNIKNYSEVLACLEFLANDASHKCSPAVVAVLKRSISEINAINDLTQSNYTPFDYSDILVAFKLVAKFCLISDPCLKGAIVSYMDSMDKLLFNHCIN